jgi:hypothetical protein
MCLSVIAESSLLSKEAALSKCQSLNPNAKLVMPKTGKKSPDRIAAARNAFYYAASVLG